MQRSLKKLIKTILPNFVLQFLFPSKFIYNKFFSITDTIAEKPF